jgi:peptidoglycan/xylan/chitin deacetylase (PgdA/CDA1 family)
MRVALTFDVEHPSRPHHQGDAAEAILEVLSAREVRATFFLQGSWAQAYPETAHRIAERGHLIGSHSYHHAPLPGLSGAGLRSDANQARESIIRSTGIDPHPWFRAPYGAVDLGVLADLGRLGYRHVGWDVDPGDWQQDRDSTELVQRVVDALGQRPDRGVILYHGWPRTTVEALPRTIDELRTTGAEFVTVADAATPRWPPSPTGIRRVLVRSPAAARLTRRAHLLIRGRSGGNSAPR